MCADVDFDQLEAVLDSQCNRQSVANVFEDQISPRGSGSSSGGGGRSVRSLSRGRSHQQNQNSNHHHYESSSSSSAAAATNSSRRDTTSSRHHQNNYNHYHRRDDSEDSSRLGPAAVRPDYSSRDHSDGYSRNSSRNATSSSAAYDYDDEGGSSRQHRAKGVNGSRSNGIEGHQSQHRRPRSRSRSPRGYGSFRRDGSPHRKSSSSASSAPASSSSAAASAAASSRGRSLSPNDGSSSSQHSQSRSSSRYESKEEVLREEQKRKNEQLRRQKEDEERMKRELDEARRDDLTVLVLNLSLKATERDVWRFFSEKCGKVRDIQVIRDARSGKSKGVGYVEFYTASSVMTALSMSGLMVLDQPIVIQASQAEKNRAAKAAKQQQAELTELGPMKIYVGGLVENLATLTESDLRELFSPFGDIVSVDLHKDPYTGRSKGYAFIHFRNAQDAREAMSSMNGFEIGGKMIKVGYATENIQRPQGLTGNPYQTALQYAEAANDSERLDDEGGGLLSGVNPRISLMQKLQRNEDSATPTSAAAAASSALGMAIGGASSIQGAAVAAAGNLMLSSITNPISPISPNICLEPLFTAEDVAKEGPVLLDDIEEDVRSECSKFGTVMKVFVNRRLLDKKVYVKFASTEMACKALQGMTARYFAGKPIHCTFVAEQIWKSLCQY